MGDWKIISTAGTTSASVADAPNILPFSTPPAVVYEAKWNRTFYGFAGDLQLPVADDNIARLKKIHVLWEPSGGEAQIIQTLFQPSAGWNESDSPLHFTGPAETIQQPKADLAGHLVFLCENDDGNIAADPLSVDLTVRGAALTAVTASEKSGSRHWTDQEGVESFVNVLPTFHGDQVPQTVSIWFDQDDGKGFQLKGWYTFSDTTTPVAIQVWVPGDSSHTSWKVGAVVGTIDGTAPMPDDAIQADFTMDEVAVPGADLITELGFSETYQAVDPGQWQYHWEWDVPLPDFLAHPEFFYAKLTRSVGGMVGGVWTPDPAFPGWSGQGQSYSDATPVFSVNYEANEIDAALVGSGPTQLTKTITGGPWGVPAAVLADGSANPYRTIRWRCYVGSRRDNGSGGATETLQTGAFGGQDHYDFTPDPTNPSILNLAHFNPHTAHAVFTVKTVAGVDKFAIADGGITHDMIGSVNADVINGPIVADQIGSVNASTITGTITAGQIGSVNASTITGTITAGQIATVNATSITGSISAGQIGSVAASTITGTISSGQIGSVAATSITGTISSGQIASVSATSIAGTISAGQISTVNATSITGVVLSSQVADGLIDSLSKIAGTLQPIQRVTSLPTLPDSHFPVGCYVILNSTRQTYKNTSNAWVSCNSSEVSGYYTSADITSVNASAINGAILAGQIGAVNASSITGSISASQIGSVYASNISGQITVSQLAGGITADKITSVSAGVISGAITATNFTGSINGTQITGGITADKITSVNAGTINVGTLGANQISSVNAGCINTGTMNFVNLNGGTVTLNANGFTTYLNNGYDSNAYNYVGVRVQSNYDYTVTRVYPGKIYLHNGYSGGSGYGLTLDATYGSINLTNISGSSCFDVYAVYSGDAYNAVMRVFGGISAGWTDSPVYKTYGTTVIDSSRQVFGTNVYSNGVNLAQGLVSTQYANLGGVPLSGYSALGWIPAYSSSGAYLGKVLVV